MAFPTIMTDVTTGAPDGFFIIMSFLIFLGIMYILFKMWRKIVLGKK